MPTPHISAKKEEIAKLVLMPGDPLRAEIIAKNFLKDYKLVNTVRNMFAFTGLYKDKLVTVMGSGMGMPSIGIYSYELFKFYDVEKIIRVGSAGAYDKKLNLFDLVLAEKAYSESSYAKTFGLSDDQFMSPSSSLNKKIIQAASEKKYELTVSPIHSGDVFYNLNPDYYKKIYKDHKTVCVEMESFALFTNAKALKKEASCILTISDSLVKKEATTSKQRQEEFMKMVEVALDAIIK